MKPFRSRVPNSIVLLVAIAAFCVSCGEYSHHFSDKAALEHFKANRSSFQALAVEWGQQHQQDNFSFMRWYDGRISWNGAEIVKKGKRYIAIRGRVTLIANASFEEAATVIGANPGELSRYIQIANSLQIESVSTIGTALPTEKRYIEIWLRGSSLAAYGYLYVPAASTSAKKELEYESKRNDSPVGFKSLHMIDYDWYYFTK